MPFIVTTTRPVTQDDGFTIVAGSMVKPEDGEWRPAVSRLAVATLEEVHDRIGELLREHGSGGVTMVDLLLVNESGGTITLPDGMTVEVEPASYYALNEAAGLTLADTVGDGVGRYTPGDERKILDAWNAKFAAGSPSVLTEEG